MERFDDWHQYEEPHGNRAECALDVVTVICMVVFLGWLFKDFF